MTDSSDRKVLIDDRILVHYRSGSFGPEILIDTMSKRHLLAIRAIFVELAQEKLTFMNFLNHEDVMAVGLDSLIFRTLNSEDNRKKNLESKTSPSGKVEFLWSLPPVGWWECVNLVDGLLECDHAAHQHLNEEKEGVDDASIELAFRENAELRAYLREKN